MTVSNTKYRFTVLNFNYITDVCKTQKLMCATSKLVIPISLGVFLSYIFWEVCVQFGQCLTRLCHEVVPEQQKPTWSIYKQQNSVCVNVMWDSLTHQTILAHKHRAEVNVMPLFLIRALHRSYDNHSNWLHNGRRSDFCDNFEEKLQEDTENMNGKVKIPVSATRLTVIGDFGSVIMDIV